MDVCALLRSAASSSRSSWTTNLRSSCSLTESTSSPKLKCQLPAADERLGTAVGVIRTPCSALTPHCSRLPNRTPPPCSDAVAWKKAAGHSWPSSPPTQRRSRRQDFRRGQDDGYAYGTAAPWIPPIRFDRAQYEAEVARAHRDRSWEWPDRTCARLVREHLERSEELDARGYTLEWAGARFADREPGEWVPDGIRVFLDRERRQVVLEFPDATEAITERADTIARLILSRPEDEWPITFVSEEREWRR
jgi:hypothetical protein